MLSAIVLFLAATAVRSQGIGGYPTVPASVFDCNAVANPTIDRFYPNPEDCNTFYRCVPEHSLAYLYTCNDPAEVFDESLQMCVNVWDAYPPCGTKSSTTSGTVITTNMPPTADPNAFYCDNLAPGYYANPNACDSFYICNSDVLPGTSPSSVPCPSPLVYNPDAMYCDWTYNVPPPCGTKVVKAIPQTRNDGGPACEDDERYECNGATTIVVDPDCTTYYNCDANVQRPCPSNCPPGLVYNPDAMYCDWIYNVPPPCGSKVSKTPHKNRDNGPACKDNERYECNGAKTPIADPNDCGTFYNCDSNIQRPCPSTCPAGLCFDESINACNYP